MKVSLDNISFTEQTAKLYWTNENEFARLHLFTE